MPGWNRSQPNNFMKIFHGYRDIKDKLNDPVVAIGMFDGVHLGHKKVLKKVLSHRGRDRVVMTFDPHPQKVVSPDKTPPRIMSLEHRLRILERMGLDAAVVVNFTDFIAMMPPEEFVKRVIHGIGARKVYVGDNFHFGRAQSGGTEDLKTIGKKYDIEVFAVEPVKVGRRVVSSTWLRELIRSGRLSMAEKLLRRPVTVMGTVVRGEERGRELGFPTANIDPHHEVMPPPGVYAVKINIEGKLHDGVVNVGFKPTFYGSKLRRRKEPYVEVHLIGYKGHLYGRDLEVFFVKKLRNEKKYRTTEALIRQIGKDIEKAHSLLERDDLIRKISR